jgi:Spy/CpxP family protein refolding chaperone
MISRSLTQKTSIAAALLSAALTLHFSTAACAQDRGFPGPPPGRGPGGFGRGPRPATVAGTPVAALADGLKLTPAQRTKIRRASVAVPAAA